MFANNERVFKRLTGKEKVKYTCKENGINIKYEMKSEEMINNIFADKLSTPETFIGDEVYKFLQQYEFLYDDEREYLLLILRNVRIRVRKYFYLPPVYVAWNMKNGDRLKGYEPCHVRFLQKCKPFGYLIAEDESNAYKLARFPFQKLYHPHIDASAQACWGHWGSNLEDAQFQSAYAQIESLRGFLNDYNHRSTFFNVNPYHHDRTDKITSDQPFPWSSPRNFSLGNPNIAKAYDIILKKVYGEDWLIDFCTEEKENWNLWSKVINFFLFGDHEDSNQDIYSRFIKKIHDDEGIISPELCTDYPDRLSMFHAMESTTVIEGKTDAQTLYTNAVTKYEDWDQFRSKWSDFVISNRIGVWINKRTGYEWTYGDIKALYYSGMDTWASINYTNIDERKEQLDMVRTASSDNGYKLSQLMTTFGAVSHGLGDRTNGSSNFLLLLTQNDSIDEIMDALHLWEYASRQSQPTSIYEDAYQKCRTLRSHDYGQLGSDGYIKNSNASWDGNYFNYHNEGFSVKDNLPEFNFISICFDKICATFRTMRRGRENVMIEHQIDILNLLLSGDCSKITKAGWEKIYSKQLVSIDDAWHDMLTKFFKEWHICDFGNMNNWVHDTIDERMNKEDGIMMHRYVASYLYDIREEGEELVEEHLERLHKLWYLFLPSFPRNIEQAFVLRDNMDRITITTAYKEFISSYATKSKELKDVLKNTLSNLEQGELFLKEVSIN